MKYIKPCEDFNRQLREGEPSVCTIQYYNEDQKRSELYHNIKGELHRENGTAIQRWYEDGRKYSNSYYLNGMEYSKEDWINQLKKINSPTTKNNL